jgi:beta-galactosidase
MTNQDILKGFQYYRAPTPDKSCWAKDLEKIAKDGYNSVKFWIQWRWNEPEEGVYDFSDIDTLMALAEKNHLSVILNLILDVTPVWFSEKYPDSAMITASGKKIASYATQYRQIGGAPGPCFHHKKAAEAKQAFVEECAKRYVKHPALLFWDLWNEPELNVGLLREAKLEDLLCYCPSSQKAFGEWLKKKYGTIGALNAVWGRNYLSFQNVELPRSYGTTMDMVDWRLFFLDTLTEDYKKRVTAVKKYDLTHPVMCHTVTMPLFNSITCASDDFALGEAGDLLGDSAGSNPLSADFIRSAAQGKRVLNSEIHAVYGSALNGFHYPTEQDWIRHVLLPYAHGSSGFYFWQYRPETLGNEAPAWGNVTLEGEETSWNTDAKKVLSFLPKKCPERTLPKEVAIVFSRANEIYSWDATLSTELFDSSLQGAYQLLYRNNYRIDFLPSSSYEKYGDYKALYFPATFLSSPKNVEAILSYAKAGGTVILEALFGSLNENSGRHSTRLPGCGLSEALGVEVAKIYSSTMIANGYDGKIFHTHDNDLVHFLAGSLSLSGGRFFTSLKGNLGKILATSENGEAMACSYSYGQGQIILLNTLLSYGYSKDKKNDDCRFLRSLLGEPKYFAYLPIGLRGDEVDEGEKSLTLFENTLSTKQSFTLSSEPLRNIGPISSSEGAYSIEGESLAAFEAKK